MVGDSDVDVRTAKAASVPMVLVSFGYAGEPLPGAPPEAIIDHFDELHGEPRLAAAQKPRHTARLAFRLNPAKDQS